MRRFFSQLLDLVLPPSPDVVLARSLTEARLLELWAPYEPIPGIYALLPYRENAVRALVRAVKYHGEEKALAIPGRFAADFLLELIVEKRTLAGWDTPFVIAMPSSRERMRERGYNQAEKILSAILPFLGSAVSLPPELLFRENRPSQVSVERAKRVSNIRNAFYIKDPKAVSGKCFILIDDVVESGSTFADASRALMEGGAKDIIGIALAH